MNRPLILFTLIVLAAGLAGRLLAAPSNATLPPGVRAVWDLERAYRETTPTRERVCLNGLWRWQPGEASAAAVPGDRWGYFKVPGCWPGITDYMQKDCQTLFPHLAWKEARLPQLTAAWYQRELTVPASWAGRRIGVQAETVNSMAVVYLDGKRAGEIRFPAGEVDLTGVCRPGATHQLSMLVVALPLKGVMLSYTDSNAARAVKGTVARRGLCGDVFLVGEPAGARIGDVAISTSVREGEIEVDAGLRQLAAGPTYRLRATIQENGQGRKTFTSPPFRGADLKDGRFTFREKWRPARLWDLHTPDHQHRLQLSLLAADRRVLDLALPARFGFRELRIVGRDFVLNGSRVFLSAVPLDNAAVGAAWATYAGARESLERLKAFGINFVYTHNYGCEPGTHLAFEEILRAADDVGMLVALSQPHFSQYDWERADADRTNGYAEHAAIYARVAGNHPSVVAYAMSHNATGYSEDMNPAMIDGIQAPRDQWSTRNAALALRAEAIVKRLDPTRFVYHHAGGNLGALHTANFYANFAPVQEMSDWFEHWANRGVKPVFLCEYGVPFSWDWGMYRGWYRGEREFGSAAVPWDFSMAEWNAQFLGDPAYRISPLEERNVRWEAAQFRAGKLWHRWDYPTALGSSAFAERDAIFATYLTDNWRAFRTWGVSAISPWEHAIFWRARAGVDRSRQTLPMEWERLQRPGFSPDYVAERYERMDLAFDRSDWTPTLAAQALIRNNRPLLAYLGGKPTRFTSKDHNFLPGETVEKQLILINNSRAPVEAECQWSAALPQPAGGRRKLLVQTGEPERIPLRFELSATLPPGACELRAWVRFSTGETQEDSFSIHVLPPPAPPATPGKVALFDPKGETTRLLAALGISCQHVDAGSDLAPYDLLIVGKAALSPGGPGPDVARVRDGLKVVVFEQDAAVLEGRLGFRVAEYGLRQVFPRVPDHPILGGLDREQLRDWRGEATLLAPQLEYTVRPRYGPTVKWCGIDVTRLWRCGSRGSVASVLIEKPARGDFLPLLDGGYSLQYSPLLEYREGRGMVLFCQLDVTGRTEADPAATRVVRNLLAYASSWRPAPRRVAVYAGAPTGRRHLEAAGVPLAPEGDGRLTPERALVLGPGGGKALAPRAGEVRAWLAGGGRLVAVSLDQEEVNLLLPAPVRMQRAEHLASFFAPAAAGSPLAGVSPAEVHNRDPRALPLVTGGASTLGDGVLAQSEDGRVVFCQLAPWDFAASGPPNVRRTFRRTAGLLSRLLGNVGVGAATPLLGRFHTPLDAAGSERRWLDGLYLDAPEEWDDPYRFFRW